MVSLEWIFSKMLEACTLLFKLGIVLVPYQHTKFEANRWSKVSLSLLIKKYYIIMF